MKYYILGILSIISVLVNAQKFKTDFSEVINADRNSYFLNAGKIDKYIYIVEAGKKGQINLKIYDSKSLKLMSCRTIKDKSCDNPNCIDKHFDYERTLFLKDKMIVLFSSIEKQSKEYTLFAQVIDKSGRFDGKLKTLDKIQAKSRKNAGNFRIWINDDSTQFVVVQNAPYERSIKNKQMEEYGCKIFDSRLRNVSKFNASFPYKDKDVAFVGTILGNDGTLYFLNKVYLEKNKKERGQARYYYEVFTFDSKTQKSTSFKLNLDKRNIANVGIRLNKQNDKLYCFGMYSDLKNKEYYGKDIDGMFSMIIDAKSQNIISKEVSPFSKALVADLMTKRTGKGMKKKKNAAKKVKDGDGISDNYELRQIVINDDGTAHAIVEYFELLAVETCDSKGNCHTSYHYYYDNLLYVNLSADGELSEPKLLMKSQHSVNDGGEYSSVMYFEKKNENFLIYNENQENINVSGQSAMVKQMKNLKTASLAFVKIEKDGFGKRKEIVNNKETGYVCNPRSAMEISEGVYIMPFEKKPNVSCGCTMMFTKKKAGIMKISLK